MDQLSNRYHSVLVLLLVISNYLPVYAQEFGLSSGVAVSTVNGMGNFNLRPGVKVGGYGIFGAHEDIYFKAEVNLVQKGSSNWNQGSPNNISLAFIDIPVMFCLEAFGGLRFNLGFQTSMRIGGSYKSQHNDVVEKVSFGEHARRFDYATLIGAEYQVNKNIHVGVRYDHSFIPILKHNVPFEFNSPSDKLPNMRTVHLYVSKALKVNGTR